MDAIGGGEQGRGQDLRGLGDSESGANSQALFSKPRPPSPCTKHGTEGRRSTEKARDSDPMSYGHSREQVTVKILVIVPQSPAP